MTKLDLAAEYARDLYSDAEFVARCAQEAVEALRSGDVARARETLKQAEGHAGLVEMRFRDSIRTIGEATSS